MKTPHLLVSLAVAATAAAAEPKDATEVAREWNANTAQVAPSLTDDLSLRALAAPPPLAPRVPAASYPGWFEPRTKPPELPFNPLRRERSLDAPNYRVPENLPNDRPRGAIPWEYDGRVFWLVPLAPGAGK
jgi:hypothetical protein